MLLNCSLKVMECHLVPNESKVSLRLTMCHQVSGIIRLTREGFLRKNIVAVSFFQNCAIHQYS